MFVLDDNLHGFKIRQVWFAERPQDLEGFSKVMFYFTKSSDRDAPAGFSVGETRLRVIDISRSADDIYKTFHRN
ncbi:MAG: hypothetical protein KGH60_05215, partial [Candidatus Micrarchaeota archaeon]|nr:hypothetical protein [Candidatus Micrarchaeota archaeon]